MIFFLSWKEKHWGQRRIVLKIYFRWGYVKLKGYCALHVLGRNNIMSSIYIDIRF